MKHYVKKVLFLVLATMLCLSSFSGCHQAVEIDQNVDWSEITNTPTDFIFPKCPPRLIVSDGETKISVRAIPGYDASAVCAVFGGGGHKGAAGAATPMGLEEAVQKLEEAMLKQ